MVAFFEFDKWLARESSVVVVVVAVVVVVVAVVVVMGCTGFFYKDGYA